MLFFIPKILYLRGGCFHFAYILNITEFVFALLIFWDFELCTCLFTQQRQEWIQKMFRGGSAWKFCFSGGGGGTWQIFVKETMNIKQVWIFQGKWGPDNIPRRHYTWSFKSFILWNYITRAGFYNDKKKMRFYIYN